MQPTRKCPPEGDETGRLDLTSLFGLAPRGVCLAAACYQTCAGELLPHPFTHHPGQAVAGLLSVALVVALGSEISNLKYQISENARSLSGSLPCGVRTFLCFTAATARRASLQGFAIITKNVEHTNQKRFTLQTRLRHPNKPAHHPCGDPRACTSGSAPTNA